MKYILVFFIALYQKTISPFFGPTCRFSPSCSQYAKQALLRYGVFRGLFLSFKRLFKCHPFHPGGFDPVP